MLAVPLAVRSAWKVRTSAQWSLESGLAEEQVLAAMAMVSSLEVGLAVPVLAVSVLAARRRLLAVVVSAGTVFAARP